MESISIEAAIKILLSIVNQHGLAAGLVAAVFLAVAVVGAMYFRRRFLPQRTGRRRADAPRLRHVLRERIEIDGEINRALDMLLYRMGCDRAYVTQYHNGGENICGVPFAKCSRTHERARAGAKAQIMGYQNLPNSIFAGCNIAIMRDKEIACESVASMKAMDDLGIYHSFKEQGIMAFYQVGMFSLDGIPLGILGIDFCKSEKDLTEEDLASLRATAMKICGMIISGKAGKECLDECTPSSH